MTQELVRSSIKNQKEWIGVSQETNTPSVWPFDVRWQDKKRIDKWIQEGFGSKDLVILGPPQAVDPGIRILTPIVEMARTMETLRENGLGTPAPEICCPIYINADVNRVPIEENKSMAREYTKLAQKYFALFHPDLPQPRLITDSQAGVQLLNTYASQVKNLLSSQTLDVLLRMAEKHTNGKDQESLVESTTAYLLAHYAVYGYVSLPEYYALERPTIMLVPQSEQEFHTLMDAEIDAIGSTLPGVSPPTDDENGPMIIGYSHTLKTAHYYPHEGEPDLEKCRNMWPTWNQLSRQGGLNGRARNAIWDAVQLIEADISSNHSRNDAISLLQKDVLEFQITKIIPKEITELVNKREELRAQKNYDAADTIKKEIESLGYEIRNSHEGPIVNIKGQ